MFPLIVLIAILPLLSYRGSTDSAFVGEWESITLPLDVIGRSTFRSDHTYFGSVDDPQQGSFTGAGTWRIDGSQIIFCDEQHGESRSQILALARDEIVVRGPDGIISAYARIQ